MSGRLPGLYLHVPFCSRVCPYCDFAVRTGDAARRARFVDDLLREIDLWAGHPGPFDTIYFGGGTPSSLIPEDVGRIVAACRGAFAVTDDAWVLLEANPEDVTPAAAAAWRAAGVQTLSLGIQAFDDRALAFLGRQHDGETGRRAVAVARQAGFPSVSLDLIYGLPDQSLDDWRREIDAAVGLAPDHVSCYQLTIHERTRFGLLARRGELVPLDDEGQGAFFREAHRRLPAAGYAGYEVSQFARTDRHRSPHNVKYWDHTPYLGLGPSAHSFDGAERWWNLRRTDPWQEAVRRGDRPVEERETLSLEALLLEALMTGLRTYDGVDLAQLERRWGRDLAAANRALIAQLTGQGLLVREAERLRPSLEGLAVADRLAAMFDLGG